MILSVDCAKSGQAGSSAECQSFGHLSVASDVSIEVEMKNVL